MGWHWQHFSCKADADIDADDVEAEDAEAEAEDVDAEDADAEAEDVDADAEVAEAEGVLYQGLGPTWNYSRFRRTGLARRPHETEGRPVNRNRHGQRGRELDRIMDDGTGTGKLGRWGFWRIRRLSTSMSGIQPRDVLFCSP